jgi:hypothetical protein
MMEPMKKLLIGLAAVALVLSACGKAPDGGGLPHVANPRAALLNAMVSAYEAGTMHEEFTMSMTAGSESFTFSGQADVDSERRRASMTMDLGMLGGSMDMVVDGGTIYLRSPQFSDVGTEWVSFDAEALGAASGSPLGGLGTGSMDPSAYAALFAGAVHVAERGSEEIDGVTTTHYVGTIDLAKAIGGIGQVIGDDAGRDVVKQLREAMDQLGAMGLDRIPFEAWIDGAGRLRRERITMDLGSMIPGAGDASMDMTADFSRYGEPVHIRIPAKSEVTDMTDAMAGLDPASGGSG